MTGIVASSLHLCLTHLILADSGPLCLWHLCRSCTAELPPLQGTCLRMCTNLSHIVALPAIFFHLPFLSHPNHLVLKCPVLQHCRGETDSLCELTVKNIRPGHHLCQHSPATTSTWHSGTKFNGQACQCRQERERGGGVHRVSRGELGQPACQRVILLEQLAGTLASARTQAAAAGQRSSRAGEGTPACHSCLLACTRAGPRLLCGFILVTREPHWCRYVSA